MADHGLTQYVAQFISNTRWNDLPPELLQLGKKSILDGMGVALSGSVSEPGKIATGYVESLSMTAGPATVIGSSIKTLPRFAAFANGIAIHADDFDDTQLAAARDRVYGLLTHPTAPVLAAALAVGEAQRASGQDLMLAYHIGVEVECKVAEAIAPRHYRDGFHCTGTCGTLGASASAAKLRGFDPSRTAVTLGIAATQASGLRENFGTMTKPFHAGHAAESGIVAADLCALGWTAAANILEAPRGFFNAMAGGYDSDAILNKLGNPWTFLNPGISIKPFPSGSLTHPAMTEIQTLIRENNLVPEDIHRLEVGTNSNMPAALIHHNPKTELEAKFSMEFCISALLVYGKAGLKEFSAAAVDDPKMREMIRRVHFGVHPEAESAGYNKMTTIIDIHLKNGRTISGRADFVKGSPADPMNYDEVAAKFLDCAGHANWPVEKANGIIDMLRELEDIDDLRHSLAHLLSRY